MHQHISTTARHARAELALSHLRKLKTMSPRKGSREVPLQVRQEKAFCNLSGCKSLSS